ncbi:unnamed protein product [Chrysoparadoxa australica]
MEPWHQFLYIRTRTLVPEAFAGQEAPKLSYYLKAYGSPTSPMSTSACPRGCMDCPTGSTAEGQELECDLLIQEEIIDQQLSCREGSEWCNWKRLLSVDSIEYHTYYVVVQLEVPRTTEATTGPELNALSHLWRFETEFIHAAEVFTWFQNAFHYTMVIITLCVMFLPRIGFFTELIRQRRSMDTRFTVSRQQKWVGVLLVGLFFFNNPIFAATVWGPSPHSAHDVYAMFLAAFITSLMFYWLDTFEDIAQQGSGETMSLQRERGAKTWRQWGPKAALVGLVWLLTVLAYIYVRFQSEEDPVSTAYTSLEAYKAAKVAMICLLTVYSVWLLVYLTKSLKAFGRSRSAYKYLMVWTVLTMGLAMGMVASGALLPFQSNSMGFTMWYAVFNLYVFTLAWAYAPAGEVIRDPLIKQVKT